jgi:hypothetical protein
LAGPAATAGSPMASLSISATARYAPRCPPPAPRPARPRPRPRAASRRAAGAELASEPPGCRPMAYRPSAGHDCDQVNTSLPAAWRRTFTRNFYTVRAGA